MQKKLEKQWWFELPCCVGALVLVQVLLDAAGLGKVGGNSAPSIAGALVWICCFCVIERVLSFSLWLLVLIVAPGRIVRPD